MKTITKLLFGIVFLSCHTETTPEGLEATPYKYNASPVDPRVCSDGELPNTCWSCSYDACVNKCSGSVDQCHIDESPTQVSQPVGMWLKIVLSKLQVPNS